MTSITIPDGVRSISNNAFDGCVRLTTVTIADVSKATFDPRRIVAGTAASIVDVAAEERRYISECATLQMAQFTVTSASPQHAPPVTHAFDAARARQTRAVVRTIPHGGDAFLAETLPTLLFRTAPSPPTPTASASASIANAAATTTTTTTTTAAAAAAAATAVSRFQAILRAKPALPTPDTAPLSERLASLKDVLNVCLQFELTAPAPSIHTTVDFKSHMAMHVDPTIAIIRQELETMTAQVAADPGKYRQLLVDLTSADRIIYDESFGKTIKAQHGGDKAAYATMLATCAELKSGCALVDVQVQPTAALMPLVYMVRERIPAYKRAVEATMAHAVATSAAASIGSSGTAPTAAPTVIYRPNDETKAPYRVIEKSLTKGPNRAYPDCSKVLDVFGCIINCGDYTSMAAVVRAFAAKHASGELQLSRIKDRWTEPSSGGWRDLMLNVVVDGVVFEIQVVHSKMLGARKGMDAHKAYNQFRSFVEIFDLLDLDTELDQVDFGLTGGSGGGGGAAPGENAQLRAKVTQLEVDLIAKQAARGKEQTAYATTRAEILELRALLS